MKAEFIRQLGVVTASLAAMVFGGVPAYWHVYAVLFVEILPDKSDH